MLNKHILRIFNTTNEVYLDWCKENKVPHYSREIKKRYYSMMLEQFLS